MISGLLDKIHFDLELIEGLGIVEQHNIRANCIAIRIDSSLELVSNALRHLSDG
jgi:hypothetical protein